MFGRNRGLGMNRRGQCRGMQAMGAVGFGRGRMQGFGAGYGKCFAYDRGICLLEGSDQELVMLQRTKERLKADIGQVQKRMEQLQNKNSVDSLQE